MKSILALGVVLSATDLLSPVFSRATGKLGKFETKLKSVGATLSKFGTLGLGASMAIGSGITNTLGVYQELAKAQGEVESLGINAKGLDIITKQARDFSNEFGGTTAPQFVKASYDIKSGIASLSDTGVAKFTYLAALTGKATKSTTDQMTSFFATGYGIYSKQFDAFGIKSIEGWKHLSQEEKDIKFGEAFSAGIAGAVQMFKTNGREMQSAIEGLGATATTSNVPLAEQLAILGSMQATFPSGSEAATAYKGFLSGAISAQEKLNLKFVDSNKQLLSAPKILEILKKKYGETLNGMEKAEIKKAFGGEEGMKFITSFYDKIDTLKSNIKGMDNSINKGTSSVEKMARAMNKGWEFELLEQKTSNLTSLIGEKFAPVAFKVSDIIGDVVKKIQLWTDAHPKLTSNIAIGLSVAGGFLAVVGTIGIGLGALSIGLPFLIGQFTPLWKVIALGGKVLNTSIVIAYRASLIALQLSAKLTSSLFQILSFSSKVLMGALKLLGRTALWVGRVFLMNPIVATVTAIAGAAYMIYNNWGDTGNFFADLWTGIKGAFNDGLTFVQNLLGWDPLQSVQAVWNGLFKWFSSKFEWLSSKISWVTNNPLINSVSNFGSSVSETVEGWFKEDDPADQASTIPRESNRTLAQPNFTKNHKNEIKVDMPTTIHIQADGGEFDTKSLSNQIEKAVKTGIKRATNDTSFEDEEI